MLLIIEDQISAYVTADIEKEVAPSTAFFAFSFPFR